MATELPQPSIFIQNDPQNSLGAFAQDAKNRETGTAWRCLYAWIDPEITKKPASKSIAETFLQSSFKDTFDVAFFWLTSGHLFVFFQGPVRLVIRNFEAFLKALDQDKTDDALDYSFFWELGHLDEPKGYFDDVLERALYDHDHPTDNTEQDEDDSPDTQKPGLSLNPEQLRQRKTRYKPLLLIVEDDRTTRHILQASMEKYCDIAVAWTMKQAAEIYQSIVPNIVFLDIQLPDGNGQDLLRLFAQHDKDVFALILSGSVSKEIAENCAQAGAKGILAKPAAPAQLLKFIDQYNSAR